MYILLKAYSNLQYTEPKAIAVECNPEFKEMLFEWIKNVERTPQLFKKEEFKYVRVNVDMLLLSEKDDGNYVYFDVCLYESDLSESFVDFEHEPELCYMDISTVGVTFVCTFDGLPGEVFSEEIPFRKWNELFS